MKKPGLKIEDFVGGWLVGDFSPSLFKRDNIEVGLKVIPEGFIDAAHFHKRTTEYNYVISGKMLLENGEEVNAGEFFVYQPFEIAKCKATENTTILVIRDGSITEDKFYVTEA
jgi:quercetin dioxygenase-like cupin family protein